MSPRIKMVKGIPIHECCGVFFIFRGANAAFTTTTTTGPIPPGRALSIPVPSMRIETWRRPAKYTPSFAQSTCGFRPRIR